MTIDHSLTSGRAGHSQTGEGGVLAISQDEIDYEIEKLSIVSAALVHIKEPPRVDVRTCVCVPTRLLCTAKRR